MALTQDEVRDRFSAYHDRELAPDEHEDVRKALEADAALAREYKSFCAMLDGLAGMGAHADEAPKPAAAPPELLRGVQDRLRKRSAGRFYNDRWSRTAGIFPVEILAALVLLGLILAYVAMTTLSVRPVGGGPQAPEGGAGSAAPSR